MECKHKFNMCRLCLCEDESLIDIFQVNEWLGYVAADVITDLLQLKVFETDGYPHVVCTICLDKLTDFKQFKQQSENSRHTYDNVFACDEIHDEHPIDIEYSDPIKTEVDEETNYVSTAIEVRKSDIAFTSQEYLAGNQRKMCLDSYEPFESGVIDDGTPLLTRTGQVDKSDLNGVETCAGDLRIEKIQSGEAVECVDTVVDDTELGNEEVVNIETESENETVGGSGEEDPLGVGVTGEKRELFRCNECGKDFEKKDVFARHLELHVNELNGGRISEESDLQVNTNVDCGSKRDTNKSLRRGKKNWPCTACKKVLTCKSALRVHMVSHTGEKAYVCDVCGMRYRHKRNLTMHKLKHTGETPYVCEICFKKFTKNSNFMKHWKVHSNEKPYACKVCGIRVSRKDNLNAHMLLHTGVRRFVCETCGFPFSRKRTLLNHTRIHSRENGM